MEREADFGGFLGETIDIVRDNIRDVVIYIVIIGLVSAARWLPGLYTDSDYTSLIQWFDGPSFGLLSIAYAIVTVVIYVVGNYFLVARLLESRGLLAKGEMRIWAYVGFSIVSGLATVLGLILLIVPGVILMVRWSAAPGYLIGARRKIMEALSDSWDATEGHGGAIFFAGLVMFLVFWAAASALAGMAVFSVGISVSGVASTFVDVAGDAVTAAFGVAVYALLNENPSEYEEVFA